MSEDEKKTFTREELCELFRQAEKEYSDQTYGEIPPLDKSFMNAKKSDDKSSKRRRYSLIATAAALMICMRWQHLSRAGYIKTVILLFIISKTD